jgi:hypothetical protein
MDTAPRHGDLFSEGSRPKAERASPSMQTRSAICMAVRRLNFGVPGFLCAPRRALESSEAVRRPVLDEGDGFILTEPISKLLRRNK